MVAVPDTCQGGGGCNPPATHCSSVPFVIETLPRPFSPPTVWSFKGTIVRDTIGVYSPEMECNFEVGSDKLEGQGKKKMGQKPSVFSLFCSESWRCSNKFICFCFFLFVSLFFEMNLLMFLVLGQLTPSNTILPPNQTSKGQMKLP